MIKVIIGCKVRDGVDIQPMLLKIRSHAMTYPGFVGAENLLSEQDNSIVATVSTWEGVENWSLWEDSKISQEIFRETRLLLVEEPKITIYRIIPTVRW